MKTIFDNKGYSQLVERINKLVDSSKPTWGKMNVAQMLGHCCIPLQAALSNNYKGNGKFLLKLFFKAQLYNDKPYRKNLPTAKQFVITENRDFESEKEKLLLLLSEAHEKGINGNWGDHPSFGKLTNEQWGNSFFKHIDHHLRQFGV